MSNFVYTYGAKAPEHLRGKPVEADYNVLIRAKKNINKGKNAGKWTPDIMVFARTGEGAFDDFVTSPKFGSEEQWHSSEALAHSIGIQRVKQLAMNVANNEIFPRELTVLFQIRGDEPLAYVWSTKTFDKDMVI